MTRTNKRHCNLIGGLIISFNKGGVFATGHGAVYPELIPITKK
jgi:hypothetical protein